MYFFFFLGFLFNCTAAQPAAPPPAHMVINGSAGGICVGPGTHWVFAGESEWHLDQRGSGALTMDHLTLAGKVFNLEAGTALTVTGSLVNPRGKAGLILRADETNTASLIHHSPQVEASVERFVPGVPDWSASLATYWHLLSSPVAAQGLETVVSDPESGQGRSDFYGWDEVANRWVNYRQSTDFETFNQGMALNPGQGYLAAYEKDQTLIFEGELGVGNLYCNSLTLTGDEIFGGWHLLGNPYAAALDWNASGWKRDGLLGEVHIWDNHRGNYISANGGVGDFDGIIGPHQAMFVKVASPDKAASMEIPASARVHAGIAASDDNKKTLPDGVLRLEVEARRSDRRDVLYVRLDGRDSLAFNPGLDAHKLFGAAAAPFLAAFKADRPLSIVSLPPDISVLPLWFGEGEYQDFSLQVSGVEGLDPSLSLWLEDQATGKMTDLRQMPAYDFMAEETDGPRFLLKFSKFAVDVSPVSGEETEDIQIWTYDGKVYVKLPMEAAPAMVMITGLDGRMLRRVALRQGGVHTLDVPGPRVPVVVGVTGQEGRGERKVVGRR